MSTPVLLPDHIEELAKRHGSLRAAARALKIDHARLSRLKNELRIPSPRDLKKLGLISYTKYYR